MAITIKDILSIDDFSKVRIIAGENDLDRIVTSVSVIETPNDAKHVLKNSDEENFKYPGDFNISSLYAYRDNVDGLLELVNVLIKDEASALCIIDSYFHELPNEVIEFANERGFAILMIPSDTSYAHVIMQIMEMVIKDQNDLTLELKVKELMNPDNTRVKIRDICQSINRKFHENILVVTIELVHGVKISPAWLWDMFANIIS